MGKSGYTAGFEARLSSETHQKHNLQHVGRWIEHGWHRSKASRPKDGKQEVEGVVRRCPRHRGTARGLCFAVVNGEWELLNQPTWSGQFLRIGPENYSKLHFLKALYHLSPLIPLE